MIFNEFQIIDGYTLFISILSLIISAIVLYWNNFNKRKPIIPYPDLIQIRKETIKISNEPCLVFYIPLVIVNKGSGINIIRQMSLKLVIQKEILLFNCNIHSDKVIIPRMAEPMSKREDAFTPFQIGKYESQTKMYGFGSMRYYDILKSGTYFLKLSLKYNLNKTIDYYWGFKFSDPMAKQLKDRNNAVILNILGKEEEIFSIKKKEYNARFQESKEN